jgi:KipI family sensor histidine kinase inhibitor
VKPAIRPAGDRGALIELPDGAAAVRLARVLADRSDLVEVVPGHRTVLVTWADERRPPDLESLAAAALAGGTEPAPGKLVEIPVVYDGVDLDEVANLLELSPEEVIERHAATEYVAAFIGFAPGFAYLTGGDERLAVPRLARPRERVPSGSVAIAGPYSGVYPRDSPGGWRLLGRTSLQLFDAQRAEPTLLMTGDRVRFTRV